MKSLWIMVFVPLLIWGCAGTQPHVMITSENIIPVTEDKTEYEITEQADILEPYIGFEITANIFYTHTHDSI